jgi:hypothetical protein
MRYMVAVIRILSIISTAKRKAIFSAVVLVHRVGVAANAEP